MIDPQATHSRRVISALGWHGGGLVLSRGVAFASKLVLAKLLVPDDFGIFAFAIIAVTLMGIGARLGLPAALIRRPHDASSRGLYDCTFVITLMAGAILAVAAALAVAPLIVQALGRHELRLLLAALSLVVIADAAAIVPRLLLTRHQHFGAIIRRESLTTCVAAAAAITLAGNGFGVWSLVIQSLIASGLSCLLLWQAVSYRPQLRLQWSALRQLRRQSSHLMANDLLYFFRKQADYILVGILLGAPALGVYTLAFTVSESLRMQCFGVINKSLFPTYSRLQHDRSLLCRHYLKVSHGTAVVVWPGALLLMLYAQDIVALFGESWQDAAAPLRILALASMIFTLSGTPAEILKAIGKPWISFRISLSTTLVVALPALVIGITMAGLAGAAWAVVIHYGVSRMAFHLAMRHHIGLREVDLLRAFALPALASAALVAACWAMGLGDWHWLLAALLGSLVYVGLVTMVKYIYGR